ncbi:DUF2267 domain-containing protein [Sinomicrobium soli]|uniref:DUF2267 domain-containing protein n=1 Tax=Sinomicrobium sp. N-1-3-6 TaxID=2219864 RepID=UPI000DCBE8D2|nr:DUF2267 domain-containing protein [Sinomicrobium sp. N-1-3-6]RAV28637.1 hypothetical protein DN748_11810 [Sinomicrobium sp. N-1-3-6]
MILKGIYVEGWKHTAHPPLNYTTLEDMKSCVKSLQNQYGERQFPWKKPTEQIIADTLNSLKRYIPEAQIEHIRTQMPREVKTYLEHKVN